MKVIFKIRCVKIYGVPFYFEKSFRRVLEEIHYLQHLQRNIYSNERKYIFPNIDFFLNENHK